MLKRIMTTLKLLIRRSQAERELDEELRYHIEQQTEQNIRHGMNPEEARRAARKVFGGVEQAKERSRDARGLRWLGDMWLDLRYGGRMLIRNPGFTVIAVLTLALGIGANTAIFSVVNAVLLRPLPYDESERLVNLMEHTQEFGTMAVSWPDFVDWRAQQTVFDQIGIYNFDNYNLTGHGDPEQLLAAQASADLFATLRAKAALGRSFTEKEDQPGAAQSVVLSNELWQRRFGGNPNILNQTIMLNASLYTVVGVMPPNFLFHDSPDIWVPVGSLSNQPDWQARGRHPGLTAIGRLKAGTSLEQARTAMNNIAARLGQQYPDTNRDVRVEITPMLEMYVGSVRRALWILLGAVGLVLLIACVNVANLLLARATLRQRELAVRAALGASRWRVMRQLLTESALLAVMGGALGLLLANWGIKLILNISPDSIPRADEINLDGHVLAFTMVVSLLTGIIFGLAPGIKTSRVDVQAMLKETARSMTVGRRWLRHSLVIIEIALTLVLLAGAGLLLRSFYLLQQFNPGFVTEHVLSFRMNLPPEKYAGEQQRINFFHQVLENLRALPGAQGVAVGSRVPIDSTGMWQTQFLPVGQAMPKSGQVPSMEVAVVSPDYFRTLAIPLLRGRYFTEQDNRLDLREETLQGRTPFQRMVAGLKVIIVDEEFARRHWPNEEAIGKSVRFSNDSSGPFATVVGIVGRVKLNGLTRDPDLVQGYFPLLQVPSSGVTFTVKTAVEPEQLVAAARQQVFAIDREQPVSQIRTFTQMRDTAVAPQRLNLLLLGLFAAVAMLLALVGIYGVMSYGVTQRTHEIGLRMALGAQRSSVLRLVIKEGMTLAGTGVLLGLGGAAVLTRLMKTLLFSVSTTDPLTFAVVTLLLTSVAMLACFVPARRAMNVDPMVALRCD